MEVTEEQTQSSDVLCGLTVNKAIARSLGCTPGSRELGHCQQWMQRITVPDPVLALTLRWYLPVEAVGELPFQGSVPGPVSFERPSIHMKFLIHSDRETGSSCWRGEAE